MFALQGAV
jgi:hypothetical protein